MWKPSGLGSYPPTDAGRQGHIFKCWLEQTVRMRSPVWVFRDITFLYHGVCVCVCVRAVLKALKPTEEMVSGENEQRIKKPLKDILSQRKWGTTPSSIYPGENLFRKHWYIMNLRRKDHRDNFFLISVRETHSKYFKWLLQICQRNSTKVKVMVI